MSVADNVRQALSIANPNTAFEVIELIFKSVQELQNAGLASTVPTVADLIPVLAADMKRKEGKDPTVIEAEWLARAKQQIEGNQTTALTTSDDHYIGIVGGEKFDEIHELVHICSAPGGESPQFKWCLNFNEGAINYFSELIAPKLGSQVVVRYPAPTNIVKKMMKLIGDPEASKKLFGSTFKGSIDAFFEALGAAYRKCGDKQPNGKNKGFSDKAFKTDIDAGKEFKAKAANWSEGWLNDRLPTL